MSGFHDWVYMALAITGLTIVTFATRSSFFLLPQSVQLPASLERALRYAPVCALTAIVAPAVLAKDHHPFLSWHNNQMWAVLAAGLVFVRTRNMTVMLVVGMGVFTALRLWA